MSLQGTPSLKARRRRTNSDAIVAWAMLTPWLLGVICITAIPMAASLVLSFTDYSLLRPPRWIGFDNYLNMLGDRKFLKSLEVTFRYVFLSVPLQLTFALSLALLLNKGMRGLAFYRSALYLPSLLGSSVAIAILWKQVFGKEGFFNAFLSVFGFDGISWIGSPNTALYTLVVLNVWTFGSPMVIFLAGLRQIPKDLYEAARIDGAGALSQFWNITIPMLSPVVFFNLILQFIFAFQAFNSSYIVSQGTGGPVESTLFYTLYLYQQGFTQFKLGYASALAWVLLGIIAAFTAINFLASRYWVHYGDK